MWSWDMAFIESFHFLRPIALSLLLPLIYMIWKQKKSSLSSIWHQAFDAELLKVRLVSRENVKSRLWGNLTWVIAALCIVALSGPTWKKIPIPLFELQAERIILLDLSQSMLAQDLKPDRITRAKQKIRDILNNIQEGEVALIGFAADPFVIAPLTSDLKTIESQVQVLSPDLMPQQGTSISKALQNALTLFKQSGHTRGQIILMTDGIDPDDLESAKQVMRSSNHIISIIGVGTEMGAPIPKPGGGFYQWDNQPAVSSLTRERLQQLATANHYRDMTIDDADINSIIDALNISDLQKKAQQLGENWYDFGPVILLCVLPFVAFIFRRGVLLVLVFSLFPLTDNYAANWWLRPDQAAYQDKIKGVEAYESKDYEAAERYFSKMTDAVSYYNQGNSLARQGRFQEAIKAYNTALEHNPDLQDAIYNRDLLTKQQEQEKQNQEDNQQQQEKRNQDGEKNQSEQSGSDETDSKGNELEDKQSKSNSGNQSEQPDESDQDEKLNKSESSEHNNVSKIKDKSAQKSDSPISQAKEQNESDHTESKSDMFESSELNQVPDDPGGLLRRKFLYQYQRQYADQPPMRMPW
jgi:Ca-activated chloride channel homolog